MPSVQQTDADGLIIVPLRREANEDKTAATPASRLLVCIFYVHVHVFSA